MCGPVGLTFKCPHVWSGWLFCNNQQCPVRERANTMLPPPPSLRYEGQDANIKHHWKLYRVHVTKYRQFIELEIDCRPGCCQNSMMPARGNSEFYTQEVKSHLTRCVSAFNKQLGMSNCMKIETGKEATVAFPPETFDASKLEEPLWDYMGALEQYKQLCGPTPGLNSGINGSGRTSIQQYLAIRLEVLANEGAIARPPPKIIANAFEAAQTDEGLSLDEVAKAGIPVAHTRFLNVINSLPDDFFTPRPGSVAVAPTQQASSAAVPHRTGVSQSSGGARGTASGPSGGPSHTAAKSRQQSPAQAGTPPTGGRNDTDSSSGQSLNTAMQAYQRIVAAIQDLPNLPQNGANLTESVTRITDRHAKATSLFDEVRRTYAAISRSKLDPTQAAELQQKLQDAANTLNEVRKECKQSSEFVKKRSRALLEDLDRRMNTNDEDVFLLDYKTPSDHSQDRSPSQSPSGRDRPRKRRTGDGPPSRNPSPGGSQGGFMKDLPTRTASPLSHPANVVNVSETTGGSGGNRGSGDKSKAQSGDSHSGRGRRG